MAVPATTKPSDIEYPSSDGSPMAETDDHRENMVDLIDTLKTRFADEEPPVYVSGNLFVYYERGNRLRHLAPDVFVVRGVSNHRREYYLIWEEGKGPEAVIEITSRSTKGEDIDDKFRLYRDMLKVPEYFLFDPHREYLKPPLQGYRLANGNYAPIAPVEGRLPSEVLGLHLEQDGIHLRLFDPQSGRRLLTRQETLILSQAALDQSEAARHEAEAARHHAEAARHEAEAARHEAEAAKKQADVARYEAEAARRKAEEEAQQLRRELDELRGGPM